MGIRLGLSDFSPCEIALLRHLVASFFIIVLYFQLSKRHNIAKQDVMKILGVGLCLGCYNLMLNLGEVTVPAGIAGFIVMLIPIFATLLAMVFLKERVQGIAWIGILVSMLGVTLIAVGEHGGMHFDIGVIYLLLAAFCQGAYCVIQKRLLEKFHPIEVTAFAIWGATVFLSPNATDLFNVLPKATALSVWAVIYLGVFPTVVAYALWNFAILHIAVSKAVAYLYAMPFIAIVLAWLIMNEIPVMLSFVGGAIALFGAYLFNVLLKSPKSTILESKEEAAHVISTHRRT